MLLVASPKDLFLDDFCFYVMLTMFADDTNLFFNHKGIKHLFTVVNNELVNIKDWFTANKLSLNLSSPTKTQNQ